MIVVSSIQMYDGYIMGTETYSMAIYAQLHVYMTEPETILSHEYSIYFIFYLLQMLKAIPLKERVFRATKKRSTPLLTSQSLSRPEKYKLWSEERMQEALDAVHRGWSIRRAAEEHDVPRATLADRVSGRVLPGAISGPPKYLSRNEEDELVRFVLRCASIGYARSRKELIALVQRIIESKGITKHVTNGWWESFCKRHPNLTLRTNVPLSLARAKATDPEMLDQYFDLLERTLADNCLRDKPCQIFNVDETGMPLDSHCQMGIYKVGTKTPALITSGNKAQVTVVGCVSAAGLLLPPMVIWDRKTLSPDLCDGEVPGTVYGLSDRGWIDMELFDIWFSNHFLRYAPRARPILLLLDGHSSHYCPETIHLAAAEHVILFALPPNTTHLTQPLDKGCFGPLKVCWKEACQNYMKKYPGKVVSRYSFSKVFSEAWMKAMTIRNIMSGFRVTGVYPVNRDALRLTVEPAECLAAASGLAFIPLYSPATPRPRRAIQELHSLQFSEDELKRFERRYENGYDIPGDERYIRWLEMHHPEANSLLDSTYTPDSPGYEWNHGPHRRIEDCSFTPGCEWDPFLLSPTNCKPLN